MTVDALAVFQAFKTRGLVLATAESCTGGLLAAAITDIAGASDVFDRGFVTYSNASKTELLGVPAYLIARAGAVSEAVARAMAEGAVQQSRANIAIAVTGIAGPGGGSAVKPVGLVHFACAVKHGLTHHVVETFGNPGRAAIRQLALTRALKFIMDVVEIK